MAKRYDDGGQRVTSCCGCYSTYMDAGYGTEFLCCKSCYNEVDFGEGDGSEFRAGVDPDEYYKEQFARDEARTALWVENTREQTAEYITALTLGGKWGDKGTVEEIDHARAIEISVTMGDEVWLVVKKYLSDNLQEIFQAHRDAA